MSQLKFDKNGGFIPQKIKLKIKRNKLDKEMIDNYIRNECNFKINYDNNSNPIFEKIEKEEK